MRLGVRLTVVVVVLIAISAQAQPQGQIAYARGTRIHLMNPDGTGDRMLARGYAPVWSPDGERLVFSGERTPEGFGSIWTIRRDGTDLQRLLEGVDLSYPSFSADGRQVLFSRWEGGESFIYTMDAEPDAEPRQIPLLPSNPADPTILWQPRMSPDGGTLAFLLSRPSQYGTRSVGHLHLADADGGNVRLVGGEVGSHASPAWSPAGELAFYSRREEGEGIYIADHEGGHQTLLSVDWVIDWDPTWSPDGEWIAFASSQSREGIDIFIMRRDGTDIRNLTQTDHIPDASPAWSPVALPPLSTAVEERSWGRVKGSR